MSSARAAVVGSVIADLTSLVEYVRAGRVLERAELGAAQVSRGLLLSTRTVAQPRGVVRPPRALHGRCSPLPLLGIPGDVVHDLETGFRVARRIDQRGDVPVGGKHEPDLAAEQLTA